MDKEVKNDFAEQSEDSSISKIEIPEEGTLKTEYLETRNSLSDFSNQETTSFPAPIVADGSSEGLFEEIVMPNPIIETNDELIVKTDSTSKLVPLESAMEFRDSRNKVEQVLESINLQTEETEEMLDAISRAKEKLQFFLFQVQDLVKSLQQVSEHSAANKRGNNYLNSVYRKKLEEFASNLLNKVKESIKNLEIDYKTLKEQEKKTSEKFGKFAEFHRISDSCIAEIDEKTVANLKETADYLAGKIWILKPKQLSDIEKVSYIQTDFEMLYDLHRRFSSIESST